MAILWKNGTNTEVSTGYIRMWGDLGSMRTLEKRKKNEAAKKMRASVMKVAAVQ